MAVTQNSYTQSGSTTEYAFTFPYLKSTDIKVQLDATVTTAFSLLNATTIKLDSAPSAGTAIKIYRETDTDSAPATFYAGSSVKSEDLNDNFTQNLYATQEINARYISNLAPVLTGNLTMAEDTSIVFEGATDDAHETTLTVTDPTADRTITIPNVTGTVITTGDTGTVTSAMIADATIVAGDIANTTITGAKLVNDTITATQIAADAITASELANNAVDTAAIAADAVDGTKIADNAINSEHYTDGSIDSAHIANDQIDSQHYAAGSIDLEHMSDNSIDSNQYVDGSIDRVHLAADIIDGTKIEDNAVTQAKIANNAVGVDQIATNSVNAGIIIDGAVGTAEIANDAVTNAKIADDQIDSEHYVDGSIDTAHIADLQVTTAKIAADAVTNAKIADDQIDSEHYVDGSIDTAHIADDAVTTAKIAANAVTTTEIADSELSTLATMQAGTASLLAGGTALTSTLTELNLLDGKTFSTTVNGSSTDVQIPSAKAVNDQIVSLMQDAGGYYPIADDASFPNTNPDPNDDAGTIVSIADAGGLVVDGSGVSTTGRTLGGSTVTINGIDSSLNSTTIAAGKGMLVQTTSTLNTYTYHRLLLDEAGVASAQTLVTDFNARYRIGASNPTSSLDDGDLFFNTTSNKMLVYNETGTSWDEVTSAGDFKILTVVPNGATTGSPVFNGSNDQYDLRDGSNAANVTKAQQLIVSLNGVIQKPNAAYDASGEGFALDGSNGIRFCDPPATGSTLFVTQIGSAVALNAPSTNSVTTDSIQNAAVTTAKLGADAVDGTKIADDAINLEHMSSESVDEDNLYISNAGSNGQFLQKQSGNNGGLTWATVDLTTFTADVTFDNQSNAGRDIIWDESADALEFQDNTKATFGTGNDLEIYHSDDVSRIRNTNDSGTLKIQATSNGENAINIVPNGTVELYYDGNKKLETASHGVVLSDYLDLNVDGKELRIGASNDLKLYHDGTDSIIRNITGELRIRGDLVRLMNSAGSKVYLEGNVDGNVELYYDNTKVFETVSNGVVITSGDGSITKVKGDFIFSPADSDTVKVMWDPSSGSDGKLEFVDDVAAEFGDGGDLQFYHDGTDSTIKNTTGDLIVECTGDDIFFKAEDDIFFKTAGGAKTAFECQANGGIEFYYDHVKKFETTSGGLTVSGSISTAGHVSPTSNDTYDLGDPSWKWDDVYATNGTIQTSDRNEKESITATDLGLSFIDKLTPVSFKRKDKTRTHYGLIAQDVETVITNLGKNTTQFAPLVKTDVSEKKDGSDVRYGLRYDEFISPLIKAVQELSTEVKTLKTKVAALEAA